MLHVRPGMMNLSTFHLPSLSLCVGCPTIRPGDAELIFSILVVAPNAAHQKSGNFLESVLSTLIVLWNRGNLL